MAAAKPRSKRGGRVVPMPKPKTQYVQTRITMDLIERVEALRPAQIPREPYIRHILSLGLDALEEEE